MITLTKIFRAEYLHNAIQINKNVNGYNEYLPINKKEIQIDNGKVSVSEKVFNAHIDFFRNVRSI